jgi:DNA-3-methyladenine glycosylase I
MGCLFDLGEGDDRCLAISGTSVEVGRLLQLRRLGRRRGWPIVCRTHHPSLRRGHPEVKAVGIVPNNQTAVACEDGLTRCPWAIEPPEYRAYHDNEWGRPVGDDSRVFEKLCLEGFQAGLSWLTILRKRDSFRDAFGRFDPEVVARFDEADIERLLADASIVRHRGKIEAAIANARAIVEMWERGDSLASLFWAYELPTGQEGPLRASEVPDATVQSKALSMQLRHRGFRFVGPTTVYAAMQSLGVTNDHLQSCHFRSVAEHDRLVFSSPA